MTAPLRIAILSRMLFWRLNYVDKSDENLYFQFCIYNPQETFPEFVKRCMTITVSDQEDYQVVMANMKACEYSPQSTRGYEFVLRCSSTH